jgi:hypothetical protein
MNARKWMFIAALAAAGLLAAASAGAQAPGAQPPGPAPALGGFSVENLVMELSLFMPEQYASFRGGFGGPGGPGGQGGSGAPAGTGQQGAQPGTGQQSGQAGQRPNRITLPEFKRDAKLMLTAAQVDALLPVLLDLQKNPFPTPSQAKKVAATVDATLSKQQKDAYEKYVKERDKAIEEMRKQFQSRTGTQGQGGTGMQGGPGAQGGQGSPGQRQQMDPAALRKQMLDSFIKNMQDYRKGL